MGAISGLLPSNRTGENVRPPSSERFAGFFSAGLMSSPVSTDSIRRMQCDHKPIMRRKRLDFRDRLKPQINNASFADHERNVLPVWSDLRPFGAFYDRNSPAYLSRIDRQKVDFRTLFHLRPDNYGSFPSEVVLN
jgi:hypothetical protein